MTVKDADMNRNDNPDVSQQPLFGLAPQGFATPVPCGAPVNIGTTTATDVDMNRDGIPNLLQQPQSGLPKTIPHLHFWCGTRHFDLTIDDSDEREDYGIAALVHGTRIRYTLVSICGNRRRTAPRRRGA